jgi:hypothetical protein
MHARFLQKIWRCFTKQSQLARSLYGPTSEWKGRKGELAWASFRLFAYRPGIPLASVLYITTPFASHSAENGRCGVARCFGSETYRVIGGLPAARGIQVARRLSKTA